MSEQSPAPGRRNGRRSLDRAERRAIRRARRRPTWQRATGYICMVLSLIAAVGLVGGIVEYNSLNGGLHRDQSVNANSTGPAPKEHVVGAQNWLIIGSDTRQGKGNSEYGGNVVEGARSDTTILAHLSRGASSATVVSIPRDSYVQIPACYATGTHTLEPPMMNKFNAAYSEGGTACTIKTVQALTHIRIDHWIVVNFEGFKTMVDALGGVQVCLSQPIDDPVRTDASGGKIGSGLVAPKGINNFNGTQALAFVRSRYAVGDGSDLDRIKDQQYFISALLKKATSAGLLVDIPKLLHFLHAVVGSLTVDNALSIAKLAGFASDVHTLPPKDVNFLTVPLSNPDATAQIGGVTADVVDWDTTKADQLWRALRDDTPLPGENVKTTPTASPTSSATSSTPAPTTSETPSSTTSSGPTMTVPPGSITVNVLNGTTTDGLAHQVAEQLQSEGFMIGQIGDASATSTTTVEYGSDKVQSSQTLAAAVDGGAPRTEVAMSGSVTLILGSDFTGVHPVTMGTPSSSVTTSSGQPSSPPATSSSPLGFTNAKAEKCAFG